MKKVLVTIILFSSFVAHAASLSFEVLSPQGGEIVRLGETMTITWNSAGFGPDDLVELRLEPLGGGYYQMGPLTINDGTETVSIPKVDPLGDFRVAVGRDAWINNAVRNVWGRSGLVHVFPAQGSPASVAASFVFPVGGLQDRASATAFGPGTGLFHIEKVDWGWELRLLTYEQKTVESISVGMYGYPWGQWSTSSEVRAGQVPYPLVVFRGDAQLTTAYNQTITVGKEGATTTEVLQLYGQPEYHGGSGLGYRPFGAVVVVRFTDGYQISADISPTPLPPLEKEPVSSGNGGGGPVIQPPALTQTTVQFANQVPTAAIFRVLIDQNGHPWLAVFVDRELSPKVQVQYSRNGVWWCRVPDAELCISPTFRTFAVALHQEGPISIMVYEDQ